ncbi:hypothetical protein PHYBOEH_007191 [Phytophthora boehmeriae]|uniref:Gamma tubulin complex component C-terminal domain-containing protein n=1 Tax=Phytophthora boehmeriae TaxID=109152 RepID=A0A8T1WCL9_9STRA|nr:hypothetical protein PHYBOEH_007191 [Phytophthora boehmeriae]
MAPVPAWTREWRPLVRQLCGRIGSRSDPEDDPETPSDQEALLLQTDRVVGQLYSHRFVESLPQDVRRQTEALATKFRVHSLEDRAQKLLSLSQQCDYQVLKLLLELARSPSKASDEQVAVDDDSTSKWRKVLEEQQNKQIQEKQLQDRLVEELFEISTNDEWFQEWEESEDESDWEISSADESRLDSGQSDGGRRRTAKRSSEVLEDMGREDGVMTSLDSRVSSVFASSDVDMVEGKETRQQEAKRHEFSHEEEARDEILRRYYSEVEVDESMMEIDEDRSVCWLEKREDIPFSMERPWLLCAAVVKTDDYSPTKTDTIPQRIIHERTAVNMIFEALDGVQSLLFEMRAVKPNPAIFSLDFQMNIFQLSQRSQRVAIGHLSPLSFRNILADFAQMASELQLLRDFLGFIHHSRGLHEHHRCLTLEGFAHALSQVLWSLSAAIQNVEQQTNNSVGFGHEDPTPWSSSAERQPTLLGVFGGLKETFNLILWLKRVVVECFQELSGRHWNEVRRAEQAKCVLNALYRMTEMEYMEGLPVHGDTSTAGSWSRYDILLYLFTGALGPYLNLINGVLFERGHFETIPLDGELFYATPAMLSIGATSLRNERNQSFREGLLSLAPFEVTRALVPLFLSLVADRMSEALASRQLKNRFLQQQQYSADEPLRALEQPQQTLHEIFTSELEAMGWKDSPSATVLTRKAEDTGHVSERRPLECMPFNRLLVRCLTKHVGDKCDELNGSITDIFRTRLRYLDHVEALRKFVLMEQQDTYNMFSQGLIAEMKANPATWAECEAINELYQNAIQGMLDDSPLSSSLKQLGGRINVRVDATELIPNGTRKVDISTIKCLNFTFPIQQPLRVLFSAQVMQKYSRLGVFLVQVKSVETALVKFKYSLRHRRCYSCIEVEMREPLMQVANMLHYTKSLLNYLSSQIAEEGWDKYRKILESAKSLAEVNAAHEEYLDLLLNRFFLLDKHATVIQYILTTFNHILRFVGLLDEFVKTIERNLQEYFPERSNREIKQSQGGNTLERGRLLEHPDFRTLDAEMHISLKEFKRQSHFLVVMLTATQKHGASPHVREIVTRLNYNFFYHQPEKSSRTQVSVQQHRPINRAGSMKPPSAPKKKYSRSRSAHMV